jgi:uncharacterized Tic20 family protein
MSSQLDLNIRLWAMWCHLSGLICIPALVIFIPTLGLGAIWSTIVILVFPWLIPTIFWLASRQLHPFVDLAGRTTVNEVSSVFLAGLCLISLQMFLLERGLRRSGISSVSSFQSNAEGLVMLIALVLTLVISITHFSLSVNAASRAYKGEVYCYPMAIDFIKGVKQLSADLSKKP